MTLTLDEDQIASQPFTDEQLDEEAQSALDQQAAAEAARGQLLGALGTKLEGLYKEQVAAKSMLEERWLQDLGQYNGQYDPVVLEQIRKLGGSEAFVNFTRVKCNAVEAREGEMVLPTEDRNWSIEPTPVPELAKRAKRASKAAAQAAQAAPQGMAPGAPQAPGMAPPDAAQPGMPPQPAAPQPSPDQVEAQRRQQIVNEAEIAAEAMQTVMDDQLEEADFNATQRQVIHNKVVLGTGILKGPVIQARVKRHYEQQEQTDEATGIPLKVWKEVVEEDLEPGVASVSPWDFFPDMRAVSMDDCEFTFERHRYNRQSLLELKKLPGFMATQIDAALAAGPAAAMSGLVDQASSEDLRNKRASSRFEVLEYHGPITVEELRACDAPVPANADPHGQMQGVVWMCNGLVLKASLSMMDDHESMYDTVPFERDDTSIFGFGLPYRMRHSQAAGNSSWRMILDNARLTVGPQFVYRAGKVVPVDGDHRLAPNKGWKITDPNLSVKDAFDVFAVSPNFKSMFDILTMVREFGDEETGMPMIAQGQQSPSITKTAEGMSILMNSANVVLRRLVKEYDDWITSRFIRRLYRWNMRYHEREDIKGDFKIKALGSAALLLMEQQSKGLMQLAQLAATNPEFAQRTKWGDLYRGIVKSLRINADSLVMTEEEFAQEMAKRAQQQQGQMPPELQVKMAQVQVAQGKLQLEQQRMQIEAEYRQAELQLQAQREASQDEIERTRVQAAIAEAQSRREQAMASAQASYHRDQLNYQVAVLRLVQERQLTLQQAQQQYGLKAMDIDSKHQLFNAEMAHANVTGQGI